MSLRRFGRAVLYDHQIPDKFADHAPGMHKWWKGYSRTNGQVMEHISPYQQKIISPLLKSPVGKLQHKVTDNWHFWPGLALLYGGMWYMDHRFEELEHEEYP